MVIKGDRKESINCGWMEARVGGAKGQVVSVKFDKGMRAKFDLACLEKIKNGQYQAKQEQPTNIMPF